MEQILFTALTTSLLTVAMHILFEEGMILDFVPHALGRKRLHYPAAEYDSPKWHKPFFDCPYCMASVWGTIFFFGTQSIGFNSLDVHLWPVVCLLNIPINGIINQLR